MQKEVLQKTAAGGVPRVPESVQTDHLFYCNQVLLTDQNLKMYMTKYLVCISPKYGDIGVFNKKIWSFYLKTNCHHS